MADPYTKSASNCGSQVRQQREDRYWSRIEMARRMIKVASGHDDTPPPCTDHLAHNIYRWERGTVSPGERSCVTLCAPIAFRSCISARTSR